MARNPGLPGSLLTSVILLFTYSGLLLMCGVFVKGGSLMLKNPNDPGQAAIQKMLDADAPGHEIVGYTIIGVNLLVCLIMVGSAFLTLMRIRWTRVSTMLGVVLDLLASCGTDIFQLTVVMPVIEKALHQEFARQGIPQPPLAFGAFMQGAGWVTAIIVLVIKLGFFVPIVMCMFTQGAADAFAGKTPASPMDDAEFDRRDRGYGDDDDYNPPPREPRNPGDTGITGREP